MGRKLILIALAVLCVGCKERTPQYTEGEIIEAIYHKPTTVIVPMVVGKLTLMRPQGVPAKYELKIVVKDTITQYVSVDEYEAIRNNNKIIVEK